MATPAQQFEKVNDAFNVIQRGIILIVYCFCFWLGSTNK